MLNDTNTSIDTKALRRLSIVTLLGFASGLPLVLSGTTLQAWFTAVGIDIKTIGMLSLVGLPYVLKFAWAPLVDRYALPGRGRRKSWMLASQLFICVALVWLAHLMPNEHLFVMCLLALGLAFCSATQDIAIDAYRTEILHDNERGLGVALAISAYRLALIAAGAGALLVADHVGFKISYLSMAALMGIGVIATFVGPEPVATPATQSMRELFIHPLREFCQRKAWGGLLLLILTYKLGDAFAERLATPFMLRELGLSLTELAGLYKTTGIAAAIAGGLIGGVIMLKLSLYRALFLFGCLQMLTNLGFVWLSIIGKSTPAVISVVVSENLFGGMGTAAFVALIMALCDLRYTATQFALLSAIASLGRVLSGPIAGSLVTEVGWTSFYVLTVLISIAPIGLLLLIKPHLTELSQRD